VVFCMYVLCYPHLPQTAVRELPLVLMIRFVWPAAGLLPVRLLMKVPTLPVQGAVRVQATNP